LSRVVLRRSYNSSIKASFFFLPSSKTMQCTRQLSKKYQQRPSPPFPANKCCGQTMQGNDGRLFESRPARNGICRWQPLTRGVRAARSPRRPMRRRSPQARARSPKRAKPKSPRRKPKRRASPIARRR